MSLEETIRTYGGYSRYGVSHRSRRNTIGIEIEYDATGISYDTARETRNDVREILGHYGIAHNIESDGSLRNGSEIVVHPITLEHLKMFSGPAFIELFDMLRRRGWNNSTGQAGGHMSVGRRSFGRSHADQDRRLYALHRFMYRNRNEIQAFGRRPESRYAVWKTPASRYDLSGDSVSLDRYATGKFEAIEYKSQTVQFRFFSAHISFDQLIARYEFITILIQSVNSDLPTDLEKLANETTLADLMTKHRRSKPNAYREYIATLDR